MDDNTSILVRDKSYKGVVLYSLDECEEMSPYPNICSKAILDLRVLKDNNTLCLASEDKKLRFFDLSSGSIDSTLLGHTGRINSIKIGGEKQEYCMTCSDDGNVIVWYTKT